MRIFFFTLSALSRDTCTSRTGFSAYARSCYPRCSLRQQERRKSFSKKYWNSILACRHTSRGCAAHYFLKYCILCSSGIERSFDSARVRAWKTISGVSARQCSLRWYLVRENSVQCIVEYGFGDCYVIIMPNASHLQVGAQKIWTTLLMKALLSNTEPIFRYNLPEIEI